ncbi:MAG: GlsB/YeaQ/YmgE family stress response membrane protein [Peptoniphilaceae bacterium]|nr:GlsB/YeaQ/YmgE family stress response membrane protein [Peptoniphilaceae bacterium]MDY3738599.1 GlsB/YeaQ/YmgE family stress response membrane protein [Peptoniphilaceae bacterium]
MIGSIIIGALCGRIASKIMDVDEQMGILANIIIGIIGGSIGGFVLRLVGLAATGFIGNIISGIIGAVILIAILRALKIKF